MEFMIINITLTGYSYNYLTLNDFDILLINKYNSTFTKKNLIRISSLLSL